jgi:hypothetical protein
MEPGKVVKIQPAGTKEGYQAPRRGPIRFLSGTTLVCGLLALHATTQADSVIIPAEYADHEGPAVFGSSVSPGITPRFQFLYYGFEFPAGPIDITGIRIRPKAYTGNISTENRRLQIRLTTTTEMSLQTSFQSNLDKALQAPTLVTDGLVLQQTTRQQPPLNPKDFDYEFSWEATPFRYDPADGVNLLLDWNDIGGVYGSPSWDAANAGIFTHQGQSLKRSLVNGSLDSRFPIFEIIYTPVPEPASVLLVSMAVLGMFSFIRRRS